MTARSIIAVTARIIIAAAARIIRTGFWLVVIAVAACVIGQAASAHAFLERAVPAVGSDVATAPPSLVLTYSEAIEPAFSSVEVTDTNGGRVDEGSLTTQDGGRILVVPLKPLTAGAYAVAWHVTSMDTHKTQGHFSFRVKP